MFNNYLKIALRSIIKNKIFSFINIIGLAVGLASSFIILLYAVHELSYDRYNKKINDIYVVKTNIKEFNSMGVNTPHMLGQILKDKFPEINKFARRIIFMTVVKSNHKILAREYCSYVDPNIFNILTLPIKQGSSKEFFNNKNSVILSEEEAKRNFGYKNPIGQVLTIINEGGTFEVKVVGVMKDIPETSTFQANIILPISLAERGVTKHWSSHKDPLESRNLLLANTYLLLNSGSNVNKLDQKLQQFSKEYSKNEWKKLQFSLLPVKDIYFHTAGMTNNRFPTGNISNVYIYSVVGFLILLIASLNIIILNTGRASTRSKEIGVRKVIGAGRANLIKQILTETILLALLSLPLAVGLVEIFLSSISLLLGKELPLNYFNNFQFLFLFAGITILAGILSGSYISVYLSKLRPIDVMRNNFITGTGKVAFRKVMVAVQMVIFIGLIIASVTINKQMNYFHSKDFGFNKNNLIVFEGNNDNQELTNNFNVLKNELKTNPYILSVSGAFGIPGTENRDFFLQPNKDDPSKKVPVEGLSVDKDFVETMEMKMIRGKSFADLSPGELKNACIINQAAIKQLSIKNPFQEMFWNFRVIGVIKDFNMHSLREPVPPMLITVSTKYLDEVAVRVRSANISNTIKFIQDVSKKFNEGKPMNYQFFDDRLDGLYKNEYKFDKMISYFTGLAMFIACLGLFGISLFAAQQRVKEIGIRKTLGASTLNIFYLLTKEFILITFISIIIALPFSFYFVSIWLQNFVYKIYIGIEIYLISGLLALLIAVLTTSIQAIKAATANPVKSLKYE